MDLTAYPGGDLVQEGLADLARGEETIPALLVSIGAPRLRRIGLPVDIELAAPDQFIPEVPGWRERSSFIAHQGRLSFYHYDFYSQALSKVQRGHAKDLEDVRELIGRGLVDRDELRRRFEQIEPQLYRFPAIDPKRFRSALEEALAG